LKLFLLFILTIFPLFAQNTQSLKKMIGNMLIVGFEGKSIDKNSQIIQDINKYNLSGVILFDREYKERNVTKNIASPHQLQTLTHTLSGLSNHHIFIALDQEGGKVARLKEKYGFTKIPSAQKVAMLTPAQADKIYNTQAKMLHTNGINTNFAPVLDLAVNPKNKVIVQLERSYGERPEKVVQYASLMIKNQNKFNVISVAKHFPGHGSSLGDSHKGFVDISNTWSKKELEPYKQLINQNKLDVIMTAHVFNSHIDPIYPATLSYKTNTQLLKQTLGFSGVIVSDDMQMAAISKLYSLKEAVTLAINSGVDILLFGNQLDKIDTKTLVDTIYKQVQNGAISLRRIKDANRRINNLHTKAQIIRKAIKFSKTRRALTKKYIKEHYGLDVKNIRIKPKIIVLHWTAVENFEKSFQRLYPEKLFSDRKDIAAASLLNVSAHFLVDREGRIYQLMPDNIMARHVIGLNYSSIGVENVGGEGNKKEDLTPAQIQANIKLVRYLKAKYPDIQYLIGHYEYKNMQSTPLWLEKDANYRTQKADPGKKFMHEVREGVKDLGLKSSDTQ